MKSFFAAALTAFSLLASPALAVDLDSVPTVAPAALPGVHAPIHPKTRTRHPVHVLKKVPGHHYSTGPSTGRHYTNVNGVLVHSPMRAASAPAGATCKCEDGTYSFAQHHRGACSHHGGVSVWL